MDNPSITHTLASVKRMILQSPHISGTAKANLIKRMESGESPNKIASDFNREAGGATKNYLTKQGYVNTIR